MFRFALLDNINKRVKVGQPVFKVKPARALKDIWKETVPDQPIGGSFMCLLSEEALWVTIDEETLGLHPVLFGEMSLKLIDYFNFFQRAKEAVIGGVVTTPVYLLGSPYVGSIYRNVQVTPLRSTHFTSGDWKEQHFRRRVFNALRRESMWLTPEMLTQLQSAINLISVCECKVGGLVGYLKDIHAIYSHIQNTNDNRKWLVATQSDLNISAAMLRDNVALRTILDICSYALRTNAQANLLIDVEGIERLYQQISPVFTLPHGDLSK